MDFLQFLAHLINPQQGAPSPQNTAQSPQGGIPVGQALTPQNISSLSPNVQPLAQIYNQNPQDPRVAHIDPAIFGYAADNTQQAPPQQAPGWRPPIMGAYSPVEGVRSGAAPYSPGEAPFAPSRSHPR